MRWLKKILKIAGILVVSLLFLLLLIAAVVRIPAVQEKITSYATKFLSNKTGGDFQLASIYIGWPLNVTIHDLQVLEPNGDTLLVAGYLHSGISLGGLLKGNIAIGNTTLRDVSAFLNRDKSDSTFNFDFIVKAFTDSNAVKDTADKEINLSLNKVELQNVHFHMDDRYSGTFSDVLLGELILDFRKTDLNKMIFELNDVAMRNSDAKVLLVSAGNGKSSVKSDTTGSVLPLITIDDFLIENTRLAYSDGKDSAAMGGTIGHFEFSEGEIDLSQNKYEFDEIALKNTVFAMTSGEPVETIDSTNIPIPENIKEKTALLFRADRVLLENNYIKRKAWMKDPPPSYAFNPSRLNLQRLSGEMEEVFYSGDSAHANIENLTYSDSGRFDLTNLSLTFGMNSNSMRIRELEVLTPLSKIEGNIRLTYTSLEKAIDSLAQTGVNMNLSVPLAGWKDIVYWVPALAGNEQLKGIGNKITLDLIAEGRVGDLYVRKLSATYGHNTFVALSGHISGLPDPEKLSYDIPALNVTTSSTDLKRLLPPGSWPSGVIMPPFANVKAKLNGDRAGSKTDVQLSTNAGTVDVKADMNYARDTSYSLTVSTNSLHLNKIIGDSAGVGETAFLIRTKGHGFNPDRLYASAEMQLDRLDFKGYTYRNAQLTGEYAAKEVKANAVLDDSALAFILDGNGSFRKDAEFLKMTLQLKGADLKKMNLSQDDLRIAANLQTDLKGTNADNLNGTAGITKFIIVKDERTYVLDSLMFASINEEGKSSMKFTSAVMTLDFDGNVKPGDLMTALRSHINNYYPVFPPQEESSPSHFSLDIQVQNHPVLTNVFFKDLRDFVPAKIHAEFDSNKEILNCKIEIPRIHYGESRLENFEFVLASDPGSLSYVLTMEEAGSGNYALRKFLAEGGFAQNRGTLHLTEGTDKKEKDKERDVNAIKLDARLDLTPLEGNRHQIHFASPVILGRREWTVPAENYIRTGNASQPLTFNELNLKSENEELDLHNHHDDLIIKASNFDLLNLSELVTQDTLPVTGILNGFALFRKTGETTTLESELSINDLKVMQVPVGNFKIDAKQAGAGSFTFVTILDGNNNDMRINGNILSQESGTTFDITGKINALNAAMLDGLSFGALKQTAGVITGDFTVTGTSADPQINGSITMNQFTTVPEATNIRVYVENETIRFNPDAIVIPDFEITDERRGILSVSGSIGMVKMNPDKLDLNIRTNDFTVFNTQRSREDLYYGNLVLNGRINVGGIASLPEINATLTIRDGSDFAIVIPEEKLSTDKGEEVITFRDSTELHRILTREEDKTAEASASRFKGISLESRITVNEKARFRLLIDPSTGDSLAVSGAANLAFTMNPAGDITLTGIYNLQEGSYFTSLQDVLQKRFLIQEGGTIRWNGNPLDAELEIDAYYKVKTSPADLIASQISGVSDADQNQYKQRLEFNVFLQLRGQLLKPDISFRIELAEKDRGAMGGIVDARLDQVNQDESLLNKQVFALLLLNRFVQEDPFASATGSSGAEGIARSSVSRFLSDQLNQLAGNYIGGAELTFNVESYEDYSQGDPQGRTEVGVALKKQFLDERFTVQIGGGFDVEGEAARTNQLSDITGDVLVEYKLTEDGRFRMSGFRQNEYLDALEGQVTETGVGLLYMKDFNKWKNFFRRTRRGSANVSTGN